MGGNASVLSTKEKYLTKPEIMRENTQQINEIYIKYKNSDGLITATELTKMTNGILSERLIKKIVKICCSIENKLTYEDLLYFYALLKTNSFSAKLNFILDIVFTKYLILLKQKYINKVNRYFSNSPILLNILLDQNILEKKNKIEKSQVFTYIKEHHKEKVINFQFNKDLCANDFSNNENDNSFLGNNFDESNNSLEKRNSIKEEKNPIINNINKYCTCLQKKSSVNSSLVSTKINSLSYKEYDSLLPQFEQYKIENNNIFPLSLLEEMLSIINVIPSLIDLVSNYIKKKTQKSIVNFDTLKEVLSILTVPVNDNERFKNEITNGLFLLFAYPNDYIDKTTFCSFIQMTKENCSLNTIHNILSKYHIEKKITKDQFKEMIDYIITELIESLEHCKFIPYIFFGIKLNERKYEKNIVEILMGGKAINEYVDYRLQYDSKFYVVEFSFWRGWNQFIRSPNPEEASCLSICNSTICDRNGKINEGLVYLQDYIIFPQKLYELFCEWYGSPDIELEREKISLEDDEEEGGDNKEKINFNTIEKRIAKDELTTSVLQRNTSRKSITTTYVNNITEGINDCNKKMFEIEINPVFLLFLNFEESQRASNNSLTIFKEHIKQKMENKDTIFYKFSRKEKFKSLIQILQESVDMEIDETNSRLWLFYQDRFEIVPLSDTLEKQGVFNSAVIILEINKTGQWPSEQFETIQNEIQSQKKLPLSVGLMNIGNSCYMNSILQLFLNMEELKNIFLNMHQKESHIFLDFIINQKKGNVRLVKEFINLLKEKWIEKKKTLTPQKLKDICGKYNPAFQGYEQQDAYDFYTFLIDNLHEGTNIKTHKSKVVNRETIDTYTSEKELGEEYWANNVRNNASYIYGLFMGQLQSILTCSVCHKSKIKYEPFEALDLPLPEEKNIVLVINLFRLPITLSPFYKFKTTKLNPKMGMELRLCLKNVKDNNMRRYTNTNLNVLSTDNNFDTEPFDYNESKFLPEKKNILRQSIVEEKLKTSRKIGEKDGIISNELNLSIPIKLTIEMNRDQSCQEIIDKLKSMDELMLEKNNLYTEFLILSNGKYIRPSLTINETFLSFQEINIYELLNYEGIKKTFNYKDLENKKANLLHNQNVQEMVTVPRNRTNSQYGGSGSNRPMSIASTREGDHMSLSEDSPRIDLSVNCQENLIEIRHRFLKNSEGEDYLLGIPSYNYMSTFRDFIILADKDSIKPLNLYEMIWEKYMYYLDSPSKHESNLWWKFSPLSQTPGENNNNNNNNFNQVNISVKKCSPFILKIVFRTTRACAFCPWFKFCTGCVIDPFNEKYISIPKDCYLMVEWCRRIKMKEIKQENPLLTLNHSSMDKNYDKSNTNSAKLSIYDCLNLFTQNEVLKDVMCENCKKKTLFVKSLSIERLPEYMIILLKRFKYTSMYTKKIDNPIMFPLNDINLDKYMVKEEKNEGNKYDLFAVVNHLGTITGGHYNCVIKQNDKWIKYDDSYVSQEKKTLETQNAYMLVYKLNEDIVEEHNKKIFKFNFFGIIDTAYRIYLKQYNFEHIFNYLTNEKGEIIEEYFENCEFYYGEPVTVNNSKGYIVNVYVQDNNIFAKVKMPKGYLNTKVTPTQIVKETVKDDITTSTLTIDGNENEGGSQEKNKEGNVKKGKIKDFNEKEFVDGDCHTPVCEGCFIY